MDEGKHPLRQRPILLCRLGRGVASPHGLAIGETPDGRESRADQEGGRSARAPKSPAQCLESPPRLLCGARAEIGSERTGKPAFSGA